MWNQIFKFSAENARPFFQSLGKAAIKVGKNKGTQIAVGSVVLLIIGMILGSSYQKKLFEEFLKTHDKETAERLSKECAAKIEDMKEQCVQERITDKQEIMKRLSGVLRQYGIDPEAVFES